ncbi:MAG: transposase IS605 [Mycoplasmataceae bacterium RV_VA103A]|nr:MAG: transposase IS605 [Mycoplasmataceae bacterium RV_VA103A]
MWKKIKTQEKIEKSFKYRLCLNEIIKVIIDKDLEICRWLYNHLRELRIIEWEKDRTEIKYTHQQNSLPDLKKLHPFLKEVQSQVLQDVARRVDKAWQDFYKRIKRKEKLEKLGKKLKVVHYPRYKQLGRYDSFTYTQKQDRIGLKHSQLWLSKIGWMNIRKHRKLEGEIKTCPILVKNQRYYAVFSCEVEAQPKLDKWTIPLDKQIGIDVNTSEDNFWVLDTGEKKDNPYFLEQAEKVLTKWAKKISRKKHKRDKGDKTKSSQRYQKTKLRLAKEAEKVANQRKDFAFKEVKWLRDNYDFFGVENFKSSKIVEKEQEKSKWYSPKKMYDSALSLFLKLLWDKVAETGQKVVKVNPAYTSQTCSRCQKRHPVKQEKSDRVFICAYCGLVLDRDINAARNILYKAQITEFGMNFVKQAHASP